MLMLQASTKKVLIFISFVLSLCISSYSFAIEKKSIKNPNVLSGNISTVGSDTLANLMSKWAKLFKTIYPNVNVQVQTSGSASAVTALLESTAQFGAMSRALEPFELEQFERKYGYQATEIKVAIDVIALFVNRDNPLKSISLDSLDAIYSRTQRCGAFHNITRWGQLGLTGNWAKRHIQIFGRNSISGTYDFFRKQLLCDGNYRAKMNELSSSALVVQAVNSSLNAIGYADMKHQSANSKMLSLLIDGKEIAPTKENALNGTYPLSRYLYVYINKNPKEPLAKKEAEFLRLLLSKKGQALVEEEGFIPLSIELLEKQLSDLGLATLL